MIFFYSADNHRRKTKWTVSEKPRRGIGYVSFFSLSRKSIKRIFVPVRFELWNSGKILEKLVGNVARVIVAEHYNRPPQYWEKEAKRNEREGRGRLARSRKRNRYRLLVPWIKYESIRVCVCVYAVFLANETRFPGGGTGFHFVLQGRREGA